MVNTDNINARQVGGDHYQSNYPHWDWVVDVGLGYFEGQATKYVTRWRKKDGLKDLEKARHYVEKLRENVEKIRKTDRDDLTRDEITQLTHRFTMANGLTSAERSICHELASWFMRSDLDLALEGIKALIEAAKEAKPVPASDSNKHAERA